MPLLVENKEVNEFDLLYESYPVLKKSAEEFLGKPITIINPTGSLLVFQREFAVIRPEDKTITIVGTDKATTCFIVILRHSNSGVTALGHFDSVGNQKGLRAMLSKIQNYSSNGFIQLHLFGGFLDENGTSIRNITSILTSLKEQHLPVHLISLCINEANNTLKNNYNSPIITDVAINVKTGEIMNAKFEGFHLPAQEIRRSRIFNSILIEMSDLYETERSLLKVEPFDVHFNKDLKKFINLSDRTILKNFSTSPNNEDDDFASQVRSVLIFIFEHLKSPFFPENKPLFYEQDESGKWNQIYMK